jgi:DNA-directed RNA polymerase subunit H (RpoH/RPB5)
MATIKKLHQIEKNSEDIRQTLLANTVKMLTERGLLSRDDLDKNITAITSKVSDEMIYEVALLSGEKFMIKLALQKITAIARSFGISEFLAQYKNNPKLIIVKEISKKALQYIMNNFTRTELFLEEELMINIIEHDLIPKHEVLSEEEMKTFYVDFGCKKKNMPKMLHIDPMARYYNMKPGDVCRILRASDKCGLSPTYRLVIKGSISG